MFHLLVVVNIQCGSRKHASVHTEVIEAAARKLNCVTRAFPTVGGLIWRESDALSTHVDVL